MSLADYIEEVDAFNAVNGDGAALTDREAEDLSDALDRMDVLGSA